MTSQAEHAEKPVSGLRPIQEAVVACGDSTVCVRAGRYATALGEVTIREDATLVVPPTPVAHVTDEPIRLTAQAPSGFATGTRLTGPDAQDINALGAFDPDSLVLRRGPGTGEVVPDSDYLVSAPHAMLGLAPDSPLAPEDTFFASYRYAFQRLDLVLVDPEGVPRYKAGMPHITTPVPPPGGLPLAHIWRPYRATTVEPEHIFPLEASAGAAAAGTTPGRLPRTLAKLRNGDPVTIVCWGDSVTAGGNASHPRNRYVDVFAGGLQRRFPNANLQVHNVSVGGSNSLNWLDPAAHPFHVANLQSLLDFDRVLAPVPDLVTLEFVNDAGHGEEVWQAAYDEIRTRLAAAGAELVLITPHFTHPDWMGFTSLREPENRPYVAFLKDYAGRHTLAVADASARWAHLWREGLPFLTLLHNSVNHPDDRGHRLFAEELWACFGD